MKGNSPSENRTAFAAIGLSFYWPILGMPFFPGLSSLFPHFAEGSSNLLSFLVLPALLPVLIAFALGFSGARPWRNASRWNALGIACSAITWLAASALVAVSSAQPLPAEGALSFAENACAIVCPASFSISYLFLTLKGYATSVGKRPLSQAALIGSLALSCLWIALCWLLAEGSLTLAATVAEAFPLISALCFTFATSPGALGERDPSRASSPDDSAEEARLPRPSIPGEPSRVEMAPAMLAQLDRSSYLALAILLVVAMLSGIYGLHPLTPLHTQLTLETATLIAFVSLLMALSNWLRASRTRDTALLVGALVLACLVAYIAVLDGGSLTSACQMLSSSSRIVLLFVIWSHLYTTCRASSTPEGALRAGTALLVTDCVSRLLVAIVAPPLANLFNVRVLADATPLALLLICAVTASVALYPQGGTRSRSAETNGSAPAPGTLAPALAPSGIEPASLEPTAAPNVVQSTTPLDYRQQACNVISSEYHLTARESEVMALLADGNSTKKIAEVLVLSVSSVQTYSKNIYRKLDVHKRQEIIDLVRETANNL